jgi:hypothetical protein
MVMIMPTMTQREVLRHFMASIAYHVQKAIRGAPPAFWRFDAGNKVRTPEELLRHMTSVMGYARTYISGGSYRPEPLPTPEEEIDRFHDVLEDVARLLATGTPLREISELQLLHGPFSDVMTHCGQLSLLRRLYGDPVPPENFIYADISRERLGRQQSDPRRPDADWPEALTR